MDFKQCSSYVKRLTDVSVVNHCVYILGVCPIVKKLVMIDIITEDPHVTFMHADMEMNVTMMLLNVVMLNWSILTIVNITVVINLWFHGMLEGVLIVDGMAIIVKTIKSLKNQMSVPKHHPVLNQ